MENSLPPSSRRWLIAGVVALALAGIFSIVLVVARTPQLKADPFFAAVFHKALVVHVDLSVLVWFFAAAVLIMTRHSAHGSAMEQNLPDARDPARTLPVQQDDIWKKTALAAIYASMALIAASAFDPRGLPYMSNYIPVITSPLFFAGLALFFIAMFLVSVRTLCMKRPSISDAYGWAVRGLALIFLMSLAGFLIAYRTMPALIIEEQYYEYLFWSGGHMLQFAFTTLLMCGWLALFQAVYPNTQINTRTCGWLFLLNTALAAIGMIGFFHEPSSMEYRQFYTHHMISAGGIAPIAIGVFLLCASLRAKRSNPSLPASDWIAASATPPRNDVLKPSLTMSLVLFIYGGVLAMLISGQDARIPAHYHGAIVAVTIALMGMAYAWLPIRKGLRMAKWQPMVYGVGQIMHISGLAYSGGYGALRKTPGAAGLPTDAIIALGFMGLGGLLAIIGGLLFVVVMGCNLKQPKRNVT